jgi:hypothetical protein
MQFLHLKVQFLHVKMQFLFALAGRLTGKKSKFFSLLFCIATAFNR